MEISNAVTITHIKLMCDVDGCTGEMLPTGVTLMSYPPQYPHKCTVCSAIAIIRFAFPKIE